MNLKENIQHTKLLFNQGIDLLMLRLQLLNLDLAEQAGNAVRSVIWLVISAILLLVALISLLFGLNRVLTDQQAVWTFFGITGLSLLIIAIACVRIIGSWKNQGNRIGSTLKDIQADIAYLRGQIDEE
ncbi:phage holin family protein [Neisseria sp. CCUG12390]|uniref:phage holin family protein n=1 Tax=Neisseria sp. CCUG12390 TaxID=3392035 RepID=UPI003A10208F